MKTQTNCLVCETSFVSYNRNPMYCSNRCRSEALVKKCDRELVVSLYLSGMTIIEIAEKLGMSTKPVVTILRRSGVETRKATPRNQNREMNHSWKGDNASYTAFHFRVRKERGTPTQCDECGETSAQKTYEWANLSGKYWDVSDYKRMCRSCHRKYDNRRRKCGCSSQN